MFRRNKENKAKLEHKLYLARETPEPIFDVSDCGIKHVPQGIYSLCRVFLKTVLKLDHNNISSLSGGGQLIDLALITILDISHNNFENLSDDIHNLKNLKEFYISNNYLRKLPDTICALSNLEILDVTENCLKNLPQNFGNLVKLKTLNLVGNKIHALPKTLCKAQKLVNLNINLEGLIYPPQEVAEKGTKEILKFICNDVGVTYNFCPSESVEYENNRTEMLQNTTSKQDMMDPFQKQKLKDFLEIERSNEFLQKQEIELANAQKLNRDKVLADILEQQDKLDGEFTRIQQIKEMERFKLIEQIQEAEQNADIAIKQLLTLSSQPHLCEILLELEKKEEERLLLVASVQKNNEDLRTADILSNMQEILKQETIKLQKFHENRQEINESILEKEIASDNRLAEILANQDFYKAELITKLEENNDLQKAAVGTLLERGDVRSWSLVQQVRLVESQLAALTNLEMDKRKLEMDQQINDLAEKRINLSILLVDLLDQQAQRRNQLISTLENLQENSSSLLTSEDFWLRQYQRLMDNLPAGLSKAQKNIDPALVHLLLINNVIHCLPFLAKLTQHQYHIRDISEENLIDAGITNRIDRNRIMNAFHLYKKDESLCDDYNNDDIISPSAPVDLIENNASAPPIETTFITSIECVICLDNKCEIIFSPCGHVCCCTICSGTVSICPLCRSDIQRKIYILI